MAISSKRLIALLVLLSPAAALACLNGVFLEKNEAAKLVAKVEKMLDEGKARLAFNTVPPEFEVDNQALNVRLQLLQAVARARMGKARATIPTLREILSWKSDDPYRRARLAEALVSANQSPKEALGILADLETRDLMPDAEGWAALARLRAAQKDTAGRDRALAKCKAVAKRAEVCQIEGPGTT